MVVDREVLILRSEQAICFSMNLKSFVLGGFKDLVKKKRDSRSRHGSDGHVLVVGHEAGKINR